MSKRDQLMSPPALKIMDKKTHRIDAVYLPLPRTPLQFHCYGTDINKFIARILTFIHAVILTYTHAALMA